MAKSLQGRQNGPWKVPAWCLLAQSGSGMEALAPSWISLDSCRPQILRREIALSLPVQVIGGFRFFLGLPLAHRCGLVRVGVEMEEIEPHESHQDQELPPRPSWQQDLMQLNIGSPLAPTHFKNHRPCPNSLFLQTYDDLQGRLICSGSSPLAALDTMAIHWKERWYQRLLDHTHCHTPTVP